MAFDRNVFTGEGMGRHQPALQVAVRRGHAVDLHINMAAAKLGHLTVRQIGRAGDGAIGARAWAGRGESACDDSGAGGAQSEIAGQ